MSSKKGQQQENKNYLGWKFGDEYFAYCLLGIVKLMGHNKNALDSSKIIIKEKKFKTIRVKGQKRSIDQEAFLA